MRIWRRCETRRRGWAVVALALAAAAVVGASLLLLHDDTRAQPIVPEGLAVARVVGEAADVVAWDGDAWRVAVPSAQLAQLDHEGVSHAPRVLAVVPAPGHVAYGLLLVHCASGGGGGGGESGPCVSGGYVYDVGSGELRQIGDGDPVAPIGWLDEGTKLLVAEPLLGRGSVYDVATGALTALAAPEEVYSLPRSPGAVSGETGSVGFSSPAGEGLLRIGSGGTTWLEGPNSAYDTPWMALAPGSGLVAAVRIQDGRDNSLGAGGLAVFDGSGAAVTNVTPVGQLDFAPAWANEGSQVAFLRAAESDVLPGSDASGGSNAGGGSAPPSAVVAHDIGTGVEWVVAPPDAPRSDLLVPAAGLTAVFLQDEGGQYRAFGIDISGGQPGLLGAGGDEHTAIGWAAR